MDALNWPPAPLAERPKKLYLAESLDAGDLDILQNKGWVLVDTRNMPNQSDAERAEAVKAYLEGVRVGSIETDPKKLRHIELEAKVYGLLNTKQASDKKDKKEETDISALLDFNSNRAFRGTWDPTGPNKSPGVSLTNNVSDGARPKRKYTKRKVQVRESSSEAQSEGHSDSGQTLL